MITAPPGPTLFLYSHSLPNRKHVTQTGSGHPFPLLPSHSFLIVVTIVKIDNQHSQGAFCLEGDRRRREGRKERRKLTELHRDTSLPLGIMGKPSLYTTSCECDVGVKPANGSKGPSDSFLHLQLQTFCILVDSLPVSYSPSTLNFSCFIL